MEKDDHGGGAMDLGAAPVARWRSNARRTISYHIIHACDVYPFMHLILLSYDYDRCGSIIR